MRFVSVVTRTRSFFAARMRISSSRSSTWPFTGRISTSGSTRPVGEIIELDKDAAGLGEFVGAGRRRDVDGLIDAVLELFEGERTIIKRGRHAETVIDQRLFAGAVAVKHAADLRNGGVRLVDEEQVILRHVVEQRRRGFARQAAA